MKYPILLDSFVAKCRSPPVVYQNLEGKPKRCNQQSLFKTFLSLAVFPNKEALMQLCHWLIMNYDEVRNGASQINSAPEPAECQILFEELFPSYLKFSELCALPLAAADFKVSKAVHFLVSREVFSSTCTFMNCRTRSAEI